MSKYNIKIDDMLMYLLKEYHSVDASEAISFFTDRVNEMRELPANITNKSRQPELKFSNLDGRTIQKKWGGSRYHDDNKDTKFYVLRGFYPDSNLPFKMVVVYNNGTPPHPMLDPVHVKIIMGMKPHWSLVDSNQVKEYKNHVSEAILLGHEIDDDKKIKYKYRQFKCMRPKGMELYREKNYEEKQKEKKRISSAKRRKVKKDDKQHINESNSDGNKCNNVTPVSACVPIF